MKLEKIIFSAERVAAKKLRGIFDALNKDFATVKIVERIADAAFSDFSDFDAAILWDPRDRERVEAFVRNFHLRSKNLKLIILCLDSSEEFLDLTQRENVHVFVVDPEPALDTSRQVSKSLKAVKEKLSATSDKADIKTQEKALNVQTILTTLLHEVNNPVSILNGTVRLLERELKSS